MTTEPTPLTAEEVEAMRAEMQQDEFWEDDILTRRLLATLDAARSRETALREVAQAVVDATKPVLLVQEDDEDEAEFLVVPPDALAALRAALAQPEEKRPGYCVVHPGLPLHRHSDSPSGPAYYIAAQPEEKGWDAAMRDPAFVDSLHEGLADLAAGRVRPMSRDDEA